MAEIKKFYWLKLKRDFFKRHDIKVIESMPNGKDYVLFYLKLLCESIDHNGELRFSATIPYDERMLSAITDTNIDVVRSAMKLLCELQLVEIMDDATIFLAEMQKLLGTESESAERVRRHREVKALQCNGNVTNCNEIVTTEYRDKIIENKSIDKEINNTPLPPTGDDGFERFWAVYPKKVGKIDCLNKWRKMKPSKELVEKILEAIEKQKEWKEWKKDKGQFIPHPSTWLNQGRWDDEQVQEEEEYHCGGTYL